MNDEFEYLATLFERELREGIANPVTGEIEFASVLWRRLLDELDKPVRVQ